MDGSEAYSEAFGVAPGDSHFPSNGEDGLIRDGKECDQGGHGGAGSFAIFESNKLASLDEVPDVRPIRKQSAFQEVEISREDVYLKSIILAISGVYITEFKSYNVKTILSSMVHEILDHSL